MKVLIPVLAAAENMSGVQRHAINLVQCLLRRPELTRIHVVAGPWQQYLTNAFQNDPRVTLEFVDVSNSLMGRNIWYYSALPKLTRKYGTDILHLSYPVPINRADVFSAVTVTLHDLYPFALPENFGFPKVLFNQKILRNCLEAADAIACVSASTLRGLDGIAPLLAVRKALVIQNAVEASSTFAFRPLRLEYTAPFLLSVAQHRRNKNILLVLSAFERLIESGRLPAGMKLVVIGIRGPETSAILQFIHQHSLEQRVLLLEGLSEGELRWCYQHASVLVAPSLLEGFGLPVAEALLEGCPIVCSDIAAFREIGGDHCHYISLARDGVQGLATAITTVVGQPRPCPIPLPHLSFEAIGRQYLSLYDSVCRPSDPSIRLAGRPMSQLKNWDVQI
jgi:glycosyltransferase involved in cell wall biosynthesis